MKLRFGSARVVQERQRFIQFVRDRGLRLTAERLALFDEIYEQHGHIDAEQLLESMKAHGLKTSRATVYRTLDLLVECGLVRKHNLGGSRHLFEHVHVGLSHDHLVCRTCGRVVEFVSPGIEALQIEICRAHSFDPDSHSLQILGVCTECSDSQKAHEEFRVAAAR